MTDTYKEASMGSKATCSVEGCERRATRRGWCNAHYERWRKHGTVDSPTPLGVWAYGDARCSVDECDRTVEAHGYCEMHYYRWTRHGDPLIARAMDGRTMRYGYVLIWEPRHPLAAKIGYVLEHRKVVYDAGIPISPDDDVHHVNGVKDDNRLENLRVLSKTEHAHLHNPKGVTSGP